MKENLSFNLSDEDKKKVLLKGLKKGGREKDLETGSGAFGIKGGAHKNKKKYSRKDKHKNRGSE